MSVAGRFRFVGPGVFQGRCVTGMAGLHVAQPPSAAFGRSPKFPSACRRNTGRGRLCHIAADSDEARRTRHAPLQGRTQMGATPASSAGVAIVVVWFGLRLPAGLAADVLAKMVR